MMKYGCNLKTMHWMSTLSTNMNSPLKNTPHQQVEWLSEVHFLISYFWLTGIEKKTLFNHYVCSVCLCLQLSSFCLFNGIPCCFSVFSPFLASIFVGGATWIVKRYVPEFVSRGMFGLQEPLACCWTKTLVLSIISKFAFWRTRTEHA